MRRATARRALGFVDPDISIHALLAESDPGKVKVVDPGLAFLSTLSLRRATLAYYQDMFSLPHFYPRSPCGERPARRALGFVDPDISIHALLAESDSRLDVEY